MVGDSELKKVEQFSYLGSQQFYDEDRDPEENASRVEWLKQVVWVSLCLKDSRKNQEENNYTRGPLLL